jgi:hypothetical protein
MGIILKQVIPGQIKRKEKMKFKVILLVIVLAINIGVPLWANIPGEKYTIILLSGVMIGVWITYILIGGEKNGREN